VLTVYGPVSGRSYRFNAPGAVLAVDPRDQRSLEAVPKLLRVVGPRMIETDKVFKALVKIPAAEQR